MGDLWSTGERKAELKGQPLDPTCPAAKVGMVSLCTEAPAHEQTPGPGSRGGREERWAGQVGGGRCLGLVVLIGSRSESAPCIRGPGPASGPAWCCVARPFLKEQKARSHEPPSECVLGTYTRLLAGPGASPSSPPGISPERLWEQAPWGRPVSLDPSLLICTVGIVTVPTSQGDAGSRCAYNTPGLPIS